MMITIDDDNDINAFVYSNMITSARYLGRGLSFVLSEVDVRDVAQVINVYVVSGPG